MSFLWSSLQGFRKYIRQILFDKQNVNQVIHLF